MLNKEFYNLKSVCLLMMLMVSLLSLWCTSLLMIWLLMEICSFLMLVSMFNVSVASENMVKFFLPMAFSGIWLFFVVVLEECSEFIMGVFDVIVLFLISLVAILLKMGIFPGHYWLTSVVSNMSGVDFIFFSTFFKIPSFIFFSFFLSNPETWATVSFMSLVTLFIGYSNMTSKKSIVAFLSGLSSFFFLFFMSFCHYLFFFYFFLYFLVLFSIFFDEAKDSLGHSFVRSVGVVYLMGFPIGPGILIKWSVFDFFGSYSASISFFIIMGFLFSLPLYIRLLTMCLGQFTLTSLFFLEEVWLSLGFIFFLFAFTMVFGMSLYWLML